MRLASVGKLAKAQVVEQVIGQLDLSATALELAEVAEAEELSIVVLLKTGLEKVDPYDRHRRLAVGLQIDATQLRNRGVIFAPLLELLRARHRNRRSCARSRDSRASRAACALPQRPSPAAPSLRGRAARRGATVGVALKSSSPPAGSGQTFP